MPQISKLPKYPAPKVVSLEINQKKLNKFLSLQVYSQLQTTSTQHDAQRAMHGAHPGDDLKYEVMPSPLHRVQEQVFELGGPWRMRNETQTMCHGHTRNE